MKRAILIGLSLIVQIVVGATYKETFPDYTNCDRSKTTADWHITDETYGYPGNMSLKEFGYVNSSCYPVQLAAYGFYLIAASRSGLEIYNISDPSSPSLTSSIATGGSAMDVAVGSRYAYVADNTDFCIVNISDTMSLSVTSSLAMDSCYSVDIGNVVAYCGRRTNGISSVDISDTASPSILQTLTTGINDARGVRVFGRYLLIADHTNGLVVVDISDPSGMSVVATLASVSAPLDVSVDGRVAYVTALDTVYIVDLSTPTVPSLKGKLTTMGNAKESIPFDNYLVTAEGVSGTSVADRTSPSMSMAIKALGSLHSGGVRAMGVAAVGDNICLADSSGIQVLRFGNENPGSAWADTVRATSDAEVIDLAILDSMIYASTQSQGLVAFKRSDMSLTYSGDAAHEPLLGLDAAGNMLYAASTVYGLVAYTIGSDGNPSYSWNTVIDGAVTVSVSGNYAYVATLGSYTIHKVNIGSHSDVGNVTIGHPIGDIEAEGKYVYAACYDIGVVSLDENLTILDTLDTPGEAWSLAISGNYILIGDEDGGFRIGSISDPTNMSDVGNLPSSTVGRAFGVSVAGKYAVLTTESSGIRVIDISTPASPSISYTSPVPVLGETAYLFGRYIYLADYTGGIKSWHFSNDRTDFLAQNSVLHSKDVAGGASFKYVHWYAPAPDWQHQDASNAPAYKDTITYYLIFQNGTANPDTLRIMNNNEDPPPAVPGETDYYFVQPRNKLWWYANIVEHDSVDNPSADGDTIWRVDSLEIDYVWNTSLLLRYHTMSLVLHFDLGAPETLYIVEDSTATAGIDPLDEEVPFDSTGEHGYFVVEDGGIHYLRTISLNAWDGSSGYSILLTSNATITAGDDILAGRIYINGTGIYTGAPPLSLTAGEETLSYRSGGSIFHQANLVPGWNLVSLSAVPAADAVSDLFGVTLYNTFSYSASIGGYLNPTILESGKGYFVHSRTPATYTFSGMPIEHFSVALSQGWNIIGALSEATSVGDIVTDPPDAVLAGPLYTYNNGYILSYELEPHKGYWVYATDDCELTIDGSFMRTETPHRSPANYAVLSVGNDENTIGIDPSASSGYDPFLDIAAPPPAPDGNGSAGLVRDNLPLLNRDVSFAGDEYELRVPDRAAVVFTNSVGVDEISIISGRRNICTMRKGDRVELDTGLYRLRIKTGAVPAHFELLAPYPNPFNAAVTVVFTIPRDEHIKLSTIDILGRERAVLADGVFTAGTHRMLYQSGDLSSGIYFLKLTGADGETSTRRILLLK